MRAIQILTFALVLAVTATSASFGGQTPGDSAPPLTIVALGDSLTSGHKLPRAKAYPAVLEDMLDDEGIEASVINHGVSGETSSDGVRRLPAALAERPNILIVALGVNDGLRGIPVAQVRRNLERIIDTAQKNGVTVLLCAMEALPLSGWQYTVDFHRMYVDLADNYKVPLVPFIMLGVLGKPELMSEDGFHPNAAGAKIMAASILPYLRPLATSGAVRHAQK